MKQTVHIPCSFPNNDIATVSMMAVNIVMKRARLKYITAKQPPSTPRKEFEALNAVYVKEFFAQAEFYKPLMKRINRMTNKKFGFTQSPHGGWQHSSNIETVIKKTATYSGPWYKFTPTNGYIK